MDAIYLLGGAVFFLLCWALTAFSSSLKEEK
jgi:hypothetical protein